MGHVVELSCRSDPSKNLLGQANRNAWLCWARSRDHHLDIRRFQRLREMLESLRFLWLFASG
jgi:hypothetical protein